MKNFIKITPIILAISIFVLCGKVFSQTKITLEKSIEIASKNNANLKTQHLKAAYQKQLIKSAYTIAPTDLVADYGQINSFYTDFRFGVSQMFHFPTVYSNQKKLLTEEWKTSILLVSLKEADLKRAVTSSFYNLLYIGEKQKLLQRSDSIFVEFLKKSDLRFKKGESNILEKTTAETQRGNIKMQLLQLKQDKEIAQLQFQLLLNDTSNFEPMAITARIPMGHILDSNTLTENPLLKILAQNKIVSQSNTALEKAKLLPNFTIGYNNNSFIGIGADDVLYNKSNRFHSAQIGLGIPLFGGSQKAKIKASKTAEDIAENNFQMQSTAIQNQFQSLWNQHQNNIEQLKYYEQSAIPNAKLIEETANKQFYNGVIDYLDWTVLINQSIALKNTYVETISTYNQNIIEFYYLLSK